MHVYGELHGFITGSGTVLGILKTPSVSEGELYGVLTGSGTVAGTLSALQTIEGTLTVPSAVGVVPYTGDYEVIPSVEKQILKTNQLYMEGDVIVNPIPRNYGLITYNGVSITVS